MSAFPDKVGKRRYSLWGTTVHCQDGLSLCKQEIFLPLRGVLSKLFSDIEVHDLQVSCVRMAKRGSRIVLQAWPAKEFRPGLRLNSLGGQAHSEENVELCDCGVVYPDGRHPGGFDCPVGCVAEIMLR